MAADIFYCLNMIPYTNVKTDKQQKLYCSIMTGYLQNVRNSLNYKDNTIVIMDDTFPEVDLRHQMNG